MGYIISCKNRQDKERITSKLRKQGLSHWMTPFHTRGESMNTICIFKDHFYSAHWQDIDSLMEGEAMIEVEILKDIFGKRQKNERS